MDNAAMIAQAGAQRLAAGDESPPTLDADSNLQL
jgi:tRNA A37 threonylcarbamoyltransferase TsaD